MVSVRLLGFVSTVLLLVGALLVGDALHVVFVEQTASIASTQFLTGVVLGTVLLAAGYRARKPVAEAYDLTSGESEEPSQQPDPPGGDDVESEFDPEMSPLGDADPTDRDRDS